MDFKRFYGTGRRKTSSARVWLSEGTGVIYINGKSVNEYFYRYTHISMLMHPFNIINKNNEFDVKATVKGGGNTGQAGAIAHGIVRALLNYDEKFRIPLKAQNLIKRDSRVVERKKYGQAGARRKFQHSKR